MRSRDRSHPLPEPGRLPYSGCPRRGQGLLASFAAGLLPHRFHHVVLFTRSSLGSAPAPLWRSVARAGNGPLPSAALHNPRAQPRVLIPDSLFKELAAHARRRLLAEIPWRGPVPDGSPRPTRAPTPVSPFDGVDWLGKSATRSIRSAKVSATDPPAKEGTCTSTRCLPPAENRIVESALATEVPRGFGGRMPFRPSDSDRC